MKRRNLPTAAEISTDWGGILMGYFGLVDQLLKLETRIKRMAEVYPLNERETAIRDSISNLLDQEVTG